MKRKRFTPEQIIAILHEHRAWLLQNRLGCAIERDHYLGQHNLRHPMNTTATICG